MESTLTKGYVRQTYSNKSSLLHNIVLNIGNIENKHGTDLIEKVYSQAISPY